MPVLLTVSVWRHLLGPRQPSAVIAVPWLDSFRHRL
jgi:hypothetical protein